MTTSTKQRLLIAFSSVLVGCAVGATMPRLAAQSFPPNPSAQRWEQFCDFVDTTSGRDINESLVRRGANGFEFVAFSGGGYVCFKRPAGR